MRSETIEAVGVDGNGLRVEFVWRGDRWGQMISVVDDAGQPESILESMEGKADEAWPASPALQSLTMHELPDGRWAALLIGMAGGSHWSASIEPVAGRAELVFDVACRYGMAPQRLGSRYRRVQNGANRLTVATIDAAVHEDERCISIEPVVIGQATGTVRWRFSILLDSAGEGRRKS